MKVLLIEDDATTVESIKLCLEIYEPTSTLISTGKGQTALDMLKKERFDAVLIDLGLPDVDGIVVIEKLRAFSHIPILVLSARQGADAIEQALTLGADDYITKPFDYRNLLKRLNLLIGKTLKTK